MELGRASRRPLLNVLRQQPCRTAPSSVAAVSHRWSLSGCHVASASEEFNFSCYLNSHMWLPAIMQKQQETTFGRSLGLSFLFFTVKGWTLKITLSCEEGLRYTTSGGFKDKRIRSSAHNKHPVTMGVASCE